MAANTFLRIFRQLSLDSSNTKSSSSTSSTTKSTGGKNSSSTVASTIAGYHEQESLISSRTNRTVDSLIELLKTPSSNGGRLLKTLEELNSLLVQLVVASENATRAAAEREDRRSRSRSTCEPKSSKSMLRRHYSLFTEGAQQHFRFKRSKTTTPTPGCYGESHPLTKTSPVTTPEIDSPDPIGCDNSVSFFASSLSVDGSPLLSSSSPGKFYRPSTIDVNHNTEDHHSGRHSPSIVHDSQFDFIRVVCDHIIQVHFLSDLLNALPLVEFEQKKIIRVIITNALILRTGSQQQPIVEHISSTECDVLPLLIKSYEFGRSDVTLNCGSILRFVSQYESVVRALFQNDVFWYRFFHYMSASGSDLPFDVSMDVFCTFKTIMTRHRESLASILNTKATMLLRSFILLLKQAKMSENYVTKRQALEIFAEIFQGPERQYLRDTFIRDNDKLCAVISYLWNRNMQIRLRCVVLLNVLFNINGTGCWDCELLLEKILLSMRLEVNNNNNNVQHLQVEIKAVQPSEEIRCLRDLLIELQTDCSRSNLSKYTSQSVFLDRLTETVCKCL